jgi:hypothetical protein
MHTRHIAMISKTPVVACEVPVVPDFITTFQCLGQFVLSLFDTLSTGGFAAIGNLAVSGLNLLDGQFGSFFFKGFPFEFEVIGGNTTP